MYIRTYVEGDLTFCSVLILIYVLRLFCGIATQLPQPNEFLGSKFDYPDAYNPTDTRFITFFSGHTAIGVLLSEDMRAHPQFSTSKRLKLLHFLTVLGNVFQVKKKVQ
jgi:hypothetical protein